VLSLGGDGSHIEKNAWWIQRGDGFASGSQRKIPDQGSNMDSRIDTYQHIQTVQRFMGHAIRNLLDRQRVHDQSKLVSPEKEAFDELTPKLAGLTYGSDEYRACLRSMKPAISHHHAANSHHPEHFADGIKGMSLLDLVELICDWKAATLPRCVTTTATSGQASRSIRSDLATPTSSSKSCSTR
jgi:hypothetical protein